MQKHTKKRFNGLHLSMDIVSVEHSLIYSGSLIANYYQPSTQTTSISTQCIQLAFYSTYGDRKQHLFNADWSIVHE